METQPEKRNAHRVLAKEVTELVHGPEARERAEKISQALFTGGIANLTAAEVEEGFSDVPSADVEDQEMLLVDALVKVGAVTSKRQARESIESGAVYVNGDRQSDTALTVAQLDKIENRFIVIRRGKKNYYLIKIG